MSIKRQATAELNHDNWDQEEPTDHDMGTFKTASKDVLEKRVIRTGKRRFYAPSGDDTKKNVFSGFQGFKKPQPASFDFLTNLTNGTKTTSNGSLLTSTEPSFTASSPFELKLSTPSSSLFQIPTTPVTCSTSTKTTNIFGPAIKSSVFETPQNTTSNLGSLFNSPKDNSTTEQSPFKISTTGSMPIANNFFTPMKDDSPSTVSNTSIIQNKSPIFGTTSTKSVSPTTTSSNSKGNLNNSGSSPSHKTENIVTDPISTVNESKDTNVVKFYSKLASLNKAVVEWVKKHVEDTPLCILTPIFRDYENHFKALQNKYGMENIENELESDAPKTIDSEIKTFDWSTKSSSNLFSNCNNKNSGNQSLFNAKTDADISKTTAVSLVGSKAADISKTTSTNLPTFSFATTSSNVVRTTPTFSFGINNSISNTCTTNDTTVTFTLFTKASTEAVSTSTTTTFSFVNNNPITTTVSATPSTFSFGTKTNSTNLTPSFSFGMPSTTKTNDNNTNTLFSMVNKPPSTVNMSTPTFSFGMPTSGSTSTNSTSTFAFNAKSVTSVSSPTSYCISSTTNTSTGVPSTFSFSPKSSDATVGTPFAINVTTSPLSTANTSTFSMKSPPQDQKTAAFSFSTNTPGNTTAQTKPFSFGMGKPFTFNAEKKTENDQQAEKEDDDEPPKVECTPVVEENSVYDKRCKVYVKKDGNFVDKGVGTLYIKKVDDNGKHQLLVRANTNLGNILINLILSKSIPIQRMGKNDVMMGCIPTPDEKPPPIPVLIRVKTSEEADELLETLNKYT